MLNILSTKVSSWQGTFRAAKLHKFLHLHNKIKGNDIPLDLQIYEKTCFWGFTLYIPHTMDSPGHSRLLLFLRLSRPQRKAFPSREESFPPTRGKQRHKHMNVYSLFCLAVSSSLQVSMRVRPTRSVVWTKRSVSRNVVRVYWRTLRRFSPVSFHTARLAFHALIIVLVLPIRIAASAMSANLQSQFHLVGYLVALSICCPALVAVHGEQMTDVDAVLMQFCSIIIGHQISQIVLSSNGQACKNDEKKSVVRFIIFILNQVVEKHLVIR